MVVTRILGYRARIVLSLTHDEHTAQAIDLDRLNRG
jgi:hypothetical protein